MITQERLKELLHYNPDTGVFTRLISPRYGIAVGDEAGGENITKGKAYRRIKINGKLYKTHRLAWLYMTGNMPDEVDHANGDGTDNRWCNLNDVDRVDNCRNVRLSDRNMSGIPGVYRDKGRWRSAIGVNNKTINLGAFIDFFEAVCARKSAEVFHGFHVNHGAVRPS